MKCKYCNGSGDIPSGKELRALRHAALASQKDVASRLNLSPGYICDIELGRRLASPKIVATYHALSPASH